MEPDPLARFRTSHHAPGEQPANVPVYDCHVYISPPDTEGKVVGRVSNLPQIVVRGTNERDVLRQIVAQFKAAVTHYRLQGGAIPWADPREPPHPGETERWIPVHL